MDKNDIIEYVMHTPHNTNKAVLSSMLNQLAEGSGGGGGSSDLKNKTLTMTVINNSSVDAGNIFVFLDNNGMIENNSVDLPAANETGEYVSLIVPSLDQGQYVASQMFNIQPSTTATTSNENNCTFSTGMFSPFIVITDYTQDASITITLSDS